MYSEQHRFNTTSRPKEQNYPFATKVTQESTLKKLEWSWKRRLEELFNDTDDQDDYFQIYSEASNTSISTICMKSNESRYTDSCCSDTDFTRRDDIVIQLSESAFYDTKVNPFPQLKFPPNNPFERNKPDIDERDRNNENLIPAETNNVRDDANVNKSAPPDEQNNENMAVAAVDDDYCQDQEILAPSADVDITKIEHLATASDVKSDQDNEILTPAKSGSNDAEDNQNEKDLVAADDVFNNIENYPIIHIEDVEKNDELVPPDGATDNQKNEEFACTEEILIESLKEDDNSKALASVDDAENNVEDNQWLGNNTLTVNLSKEKIENIVEGDQKGNYIATVDIEKNDILDDQCHDRYSPSNNHSKVNSTENVSVLKISIPEDVESTSLSRKNSLTSRNSQTTHRDTIGESPRSTSYTNEILRRAASEQQPTTSSFSTANPTTEQRKKRYSTRNRSKAVDTNHRRNVKRLASQSSGCTEVTSTTIVHVTTNDDGIFDALADMPDFINSSVIDLASSYIDERLRLQKNQRTRFLDFDSDFPSTTSVSSFTPSWRNERLSSLYSDYLSPTEAYAQLNKLLSDGTNENLKAVTYDEYNDIRFDDEIPSSEDEFLSDVDDLAVTNRKYTPPESELRRQVAKILRKLHPLENDYGIIVNDMLSKYVKYIHSKQRVAKINRIVEVVDLPITQQEKTELLIQREIDDKKLNREFYYSEMEPTYFTELGERRREAIVQKYLRCHNDRVFCHNYFQRSIEDRPASKLLWRVAKLKKEMGLIFA